MRWEGGCAIWLGGGGDPSLSCGISAGGRRCSSSPCQHNGVCEDSIRGYTCTCAEGYEGENCAFGKASPPSSEKPYLSCRRGSPGNRTQLSHYSQLPVFRMKHAVLGRAGVICAACLPKRYGIPRLRRLPLPPEPPFSGEAAKGLKQVPFTGGCPLPPRLPGCLPCRGPRQHVA